MLDVTLNVEGKENILTAGGPNSKALRPEIFQSDVKTKKDQTTRSHLVVC